MGSGRRPVGFSEHDRLCAAKNRYLSAHWAKFTKSPQATGPENIGPERPLPGLLAAAPVLMQLHLNEISHHVANGAHAVLLIGRAGWHTTANLDVPTNHTDHRLKKCGNGPISVIPSDRWCYPRK